MIAYTAVCGPHHSASDSDLLEAQNGAFWSALGRLGTLRWSRLAKEDPRTPSRVQQLSQNGGQLRLKIESKIVLISGAEKVVDLASVKLAKASPEVLQSM